MLVSKENKTYDTIYYKLHEGFLHICISDGPPLLDGVYSYMKKATITNVEGVSKIILDGTTPSVNGFHIQIVSDKWLIIDQLTHLS